MLNETCADVESADVQSSEGALLGALISTSSMETGFVPIRVRLSEDGDDEDYDANLATSANFDSVSEQMDVLSNTNSVSPSGSFKEFFAFSDVRSITFNGALRKLNELNSGVSSLDTSLLENTSEEAFRFRMMEIALSNHLSLGDEVVHDILNALLPVVRDYSKLSYPAHEEAGYCFVRDMPVAKPTADGDYDNLDGPDDVDVEGFYESSDLEHAEDGELLPFCAQGLPISAMVDDESEDHEVCHVLPPLKLPITPRIAYPECAACVPFDEMENQNVHDYEHASSGAKNAGNQDMLLGEKNLVKYRNIALSCGLTEADANEDTSLHEMRKLLSKAKSRNESEQVRTIKDSSISKYLDGDTIRDAGLNPRQLEETEHKGSQIIDAGAAKFDEEEEKMEPTAVRVLSSKCSAPLATGMPFLGELRPFLLAQPAGMGHTFPSLDHNFHAIQWTNGTPVPSSSLANQIDIAEGMDNPRKELQMLGVKFLRLACRLGQSVRNVVVAQVLYRLELVEQLRSERMSRDLSLENLMSLAEKHESAGQGDLDFECTILVLGKSGVGKSATLNSLFDAVKSGTDAYKAATKKVNEILGIVNGIKLRIIDTPGLLTSFADQQYNLRIMSSVKHFIKKSRPDIVLYFDRLDMQCRDCGDSFLLRTVTDTLGVAIWYNVVVVLTHGSSPPPDGPNELPITYEMFVAQRSHAIQQTIRQAAGDMRLMNPVSLVENHVACEVNRPGHCVPPNGQVWKPQLLLLCFASKILAEANTLMKLQDSRLAKSSWVRPQVPPLPFLLSSVLQSRAELKRTNEQVDDEEGSDSDEAYLNGGEDCNILPPFRRLTRDELRSLDKEERSLYHEEYREKLFMKKQLKAERARKKEQKRRLGGQPNEASDSIEEHLLELAQCAVPVTMPDMTLPSSLDSGNPTHRYHFLDTASQWLVHPVHYIHGWDHESGYDGLNLERIFVSKKIPFSVSEQITKDKKEASMQMKCSTFFENSYGKIAQAGLDIQTLGKDVLCTIGKVSNLKKNKTTCGLSVTKLGNTLTAGMKVEDCLLVEKRFKLIKNGGALRCKNDFPNGASLDTFIREKDHPIDYSLFTVGVSILNWHGDLAIGGSLQLQFLLGKTMIVGRANLNNKKAGQVSIASCSDKLQLAFIGLIPLLRAFINNKILDVN